MKDVTTFAVAQLKPRGRRQTVTASNRKQLDLLAYRLRCAAEHLAATDLTDVPPDIAVSVARAAVKLQAAHTQLTLLCPDLPPWPTTTDEEGTTCPNGS